MPKVNDPPVTPDMQLIEKNEAFQIRKKKGNKNISRYNGADVLLFCFFFDFLWFFFNFENKFYWDHFKKKVQRIQVLFSAGKYSE